MAIIDIELFAAAHDAMGADRIQIDVTLPISAGDLLALLGQHRPELSRILPGSRLACELEFLAKDDMIDQKKSIALIPPVSGG
jgi:molybdopterin converting factor small subunit